MIGLPYCEKNYDDMLSRFHLVPERNGQTDRQICYINIYIKIGYRYNFLNSLLLTLFCSEVKLHQRLEAESHWVGKHSAEHHRQGRWSLGSTTACMREGEWASFWSSAVNSRFFSKPTDHKTGSFQSHPQSTGENALQFTCSACGSLQGNIASKQASCLLLDQCMSVAHITTYKMKNTWQIKLIITIQLVFKN